MSERAEIDGVRLYVGKKVHYKVSHGPIENGVIKSLSDANHVFVVYNCGGNWMKYHNYTAARTHISDLKLGWSDDARNA